MYKNTRIAVVIPCYNVAKHIKDVTSRIPDFVDAIYCVDDCSQDNTPNVISQLNDKRITLIRNTANLGVGGAMVTGYERSLSDKADIILKLDGDGQMPPEIMEDFILPIINDEVDYTKGNRFTKIEDIESMPVLRVIGNIGLSFLSKLSSGYWSIFDPTNGYTAVKASILCEIPLNKLHNQYFFESDLLFRLYLTKAVVKDIPMKAVYADEQSHLKISKVIFSFLFNHICNFFKRVTYVYFLLDFGLASIQLLFGLPLFLFGIVYGWIRWSVSIETGVTQSSGTVMISALSIILGVQFLLAFFNHDIKTSPKRDN